MSRIILIRYMVNHYFPPFCSHFQIQIIE